MTLTYTGSLEKTRGDIDILHRKCDATCHFLLGETCGVSDLDINHVTDLAQLTERWEYLPSCPTPRRYSQLFSPMWCVVRTSRGLLAIRNVGYRLPYGHVVSVKVRQMAKYDNGHINCSVGTAIEQKNRK